jgi:hypothetical protein
MTGIGVAEPALVLEAQAVAAANINEHEQTPRIVFILIEFIFNLRGFGFPRLYLFTDVSRTAGTRGDHPSLAIPLDSKYWTKLNAFITSQMRLHSLQFGW